MKTGKLIMTFHVSINRDDITEMIMPSGLQARSAPGRQTFR